MKIALDSITPEGVSLTESIAASSWDMDSTDFTFPGNIDMQAVFRRIGDEILVTAHVRFERIMSCVRCLSSVSQQLVRSFDFNYDSAAIKDVLDIDTDIREEIVLDIPMKILCRPDCKGVCPGCGANRNVEPCACTAVSAENIVDKIKINVAGPRADCSMSAGSIPVCAVETAAGKKKKKTTPKRSFSNNKKNKGG